MSVQTACDHCGARFRVSAESAGRTATCKKCGRRFKISVQHADGVSASESADDGDYMTRFNAVKRELIGRLGPTDGKVHFSPIPLYLDPARGAAESLTFREHVPGFTYCTCPLSMYSQQKPGPNGNYELMMCSRDEAAFIPGFLGNLAKYTFEAILAPGHTMDLGTSQPPGSTIRGLLAAEPDVSPSAFEIDGRQCAILLLMGITQAEMNACQEYGSDGVLLKLKARQVFQYTTLSRKSVI